MSEHGGRRGEIVSVPTAYFAWKLIENWVERDPDFVPRIERKIASFHKNLADLREKGEEMVNSSFTPQQAKHCIDEKMDKNTYTFLLRNHQSFPTEDW